MVAGQPTSLAAFLDRFAARFPRTEARRQMRAYVQSLLTDTTRKNSWTLAHQAGDPGPQKMQRLLNFYAWDHHGVRDDLRAIVVEALHGTHDEILTVGENSFHKKGNASAGVARQYSHTTGRLDNTQIGVFLAYASTRGQALIDRELYLPPEWTNDRDRCRRAGINDTIHPATKPALAQRMIDRAIRTNTPFHWVTADTDYGHDPTFRDWLQTRTIAHVLAISQQEAARCGNHDPNSIATWIRNSRAHQNRGTPRHHWTTLDLRPLHRPGWHQWLLARRTGNETACYLCCGPARTTTAELARVAGTARAIHHCLQIAKNETGLGLYQVRGYQAWYRHITLSMVAAAFLMITRDLARRGSGAPS